MRPQRSAGGGLASKNQQNQACVMCALPVGRSQLIAHENQVRTHARTVFARSRLGNRSGRNHRPTPSHRRIHPLSSLARARARGRRDPAPHADAPREINAAAGASAQRNDSAPFFRYSEFLPVPCSWRGQYFGPAGLSCIVIFF